VFGLRKRPAAPDQKAVADRALCLSAVTMLGAIAGAVGAGEMEADQAARYLKESHRWLIREQLASALSIRERALLAKAIGDWSEREAADAVGSTGALGALLWALSALDEMPRSDVPYERLTELVPLLAPTADFRASVSLRPANVIASARELAATDTERRRTLGWLGGEFADWDG
jgi:hypothetical protein